MSISEIFETLMLACFSVGWYWSIFTMLWTGRPYGKSAAFVTFTVLGYGLGLGAQLIEWCGGRSLNYLMIMYAWNLTVTVIDLGLLSVLTLRQRRAEQIILNQPAPPSHEAGTDTFPDLMILGTPDPRLINR